MARKVKCVDTGELSTSDLAYKAPNGKYFSSEANYKQWEENKTYRLKCIDKMYEIMGYKPKMILPTYFFKKLKDFEGVGYLALYNTMITQSKSIDWALKNKDFGSETAKVMYIVAILNNNVMDEYKKIVKEKREANRKINTIMPDEFVMDLPVEQKKSVDISRWVEDE